MTEQDLDDPDVHAAQQQVAGETVTQGLNTLLIPRPR
jgi:hypothetical protein